MSCSRIGVIATCLTVTLGAAQARAQQAQPPAEAAEALFREGHVLLKQERYQESCSKFAESQRLDAASGTLLALAYCEERAGRLASAWLTYREAMALAEKEQHAERHAAAAERADALFPRLSTLTIEVPEPLAGKAELRVRKDGRELEQKLWGTPLPVDGGRHLLEASATGRKVWSFTVTVQREGDHQTVTVSDLKAEAAGPNVERAGAGGRSSPAAPAAPLAPSPSGISRRDLKYAGWGSAIGSALSVGVGVTLALVADSKNEQSKRDGHCDATGCDPQGLSLRNSALSNARWATVSFVIGGVFAASSVTLFVLSDATSMSSSPGVPAKRSGISGLGLRGNF